MNLNLKQLSEKLTPQIKRSTSSELKKIERNYKKKREAEMAKKDKKDDDNVVVRKTATMTDLDDIVNMKKKRAVLNELDEFVYNQEQRKKERESGETMAVVRRQLEALGSLDAAALKRIPIAYEPVWAIGTGKTATPADAAEVHSGIRAWFVDKGVDAEAVRVLYGGSVNTKNVRELVAEPDVDGVLVGGASLDPVGWAEIAGTRTD